MLRSSTTSPSSLADIPGSLHRSGSKCSCTRLSASPSRHEVSTVAARLTLPCALFQAVSKPNTVQEVASLATLQQVAETRYRPEQLKPCVRQRAEGQLAGRQLFLVCRGLYLRARPVWGLGYEVVCRDGASHLGL